jgi:hypothetical protein
MIARRRIVRAITPATVSQAGNRAKLGVPFSACPYTRDPVRAFRSILLPSVACLIVGVLASVGAPGGRWTNRVFDFEMWLENDPGGAYIPAAHELYSAHGHTSYVGHPGTPLVLVLHAEQAAMYALARLGGTPLSFTDFVARHFLLVWLVAKLSIVVLHVLCLPLLFAYARRLTGATDLASLGVAIYATSFPFLYYLTRVSVEPLMVFFFLATVVGLLRAEEASAASWRPEAWAAVAGVCAASAFFTKLHLMFFFPAFAGCAFFFGLGGVARHPLRRRLLGVGAYAAGAAVAGIAYASLVDWPEFLRYWGFVIVGPNRATPPGAFAAAALAAVRGFEPSSLLPSISQRGCLFLFEDATALTVFVGIARSRREEGCRRRLLTWMLAYSAVVVTTWFLRSGGRDFSGFHYLFPALAALAPMAALGIATSLAGVRRRGMVAAASVLVLHGVAIVAALDSKRQDANLFRRSVAPRYQAALDRARPDERTLVVGLDPNQSLEPHGFSVRDAAPGRSSALVDTLESRFTKSPAVPTAWVLDFTADDPGPWSAAEWQARGRRRPTADIIGASNEHPR